jgi:hypothetical protein
MKKATPKRPAVSVDELPEDMLMPVVRAWTELVSKCGKDEAAHVFPLIARAIMCALVGEQRSRKEWDRADAAVRRLEQQQAKREQPPKDSKRPPGRPKGATKNVDELVPHFLTLRRLHREQAQAAGEKPMSDTQLAKLMATEVMRPEAEEPPSYSGGSFVDDDGHTVGIEIVPDPPFGHFGGSADGLERRLLASTQSSRRPQVMSVKKTPPKT